MTQLNGVRKNFQFIFFLISATIKDVQRKILNWSKRHSWGKTSKMFQERKKIPNFFRHLLLSISNSFLNASLCAFFSIVHRYFGLAPHEEWKRKKKTPVCVHFRGFNLKLRLSISESTIRCIEFIYFFQRWQRFMIHMKCQTNNKNP